ncbi:hypothetical protein BJX64DRAFT_252197 [Aspergillus heterothallicus]
MGWMPPPTLRISIDASARKSNRDNRRSLPFLLTSLPFAWGEAIGFAASQSSILSRCLYNSSGRWIGIREN